MIKKDVVMRTQVYTIYSSEKQERMKVYFELNEKFENCLAKCQHLSDEAKDECGKDCEKIYDQYADQLYDRYKDNKEKLDLEVKNLPQFTARPREGRDTFFYKVFNFPFSDLWDSNDKKSQATENAKQN